MTRKEKAYSLGQEYFPSANSIWARPNFEAQWVSDACMRMADWERKRLVDMACELLREYMYVEHIFEYSDDDEPVRYVCASACNSVDEFINKFKKSIEEKQ
jgi:hypothetical protein